MADPSNPILTRRQFLNQFPEFKDTDSGLVQSKIDDAHRRVDEVVWGGKASMGIAWLAAHLIAMTPIGVNARIGKDKDDTLYRKVFKSMQLEVTSGYRVL